MLKVAVINEVSACSRNQDVIKALQKQGNVEIYNAGMTNPNEEPQLTYIQTGIMSAILLNTDICDMVVGGCGTGQGYLNSVMQYPNVFCGLILEPVDALLFSQINGGNCISLALNKGYGWAGDINLDYIFEKLFKNTPGGGYPAERQKSQKESREILKQISKISHKSMTELLKEIDKSILAPISKSKKFMEQLSSHTKYNEMAKNIFKVLTFIN